jgi:hypothetical protein
MRTGGRWELLRDPCLPQRLIVGGRGGGPITIQIETDRDESLIAHGASVHEGGARRWFVE